VDDSAVLNVAAGADDDPVHVRAQHAIVPDARFRPELHLAYQLRAGGDKGSRVQLRLMAFEREHRQPFSSLAATGA
jgi:hypothetical protein